MSRKRTPEQEALDEQRRMVELDAEYVLALRTVRWWAECLPIRAEVNGAKGSLLTDEVADAVLTLLHHCEAERYRLAQRQLEEARGKQ